MQILRMSVVALTVAAAMTPAAAPAATAHPDACPDQPDVYHFYSIATSNRPTNLYSAYIKGPGTITYNKTATATVGGSLTATTSADVDAIVAGASVSAGVTLSGSRSWTDGFSYSLSVPAGQTRRMRLFQQSRSMTVTKRAFDVGACNYYTAYTNQPVNLSRAARVDLWALEA